MQLESAQNVSCEIPWKCSDDRPQMFSLQEQIFSRTEATPNANFSESHHGFFQSVGHCSMYFRSLLCIVDGGLRDHFECLFARRLGDILCLHACMVQARDVNVQVDSCLRHSDREWSIHEGRIFGVCTCKRRSSSFHEPLCCACLFLARQTSFNGVQIKFYIMSCFVTFTNDM